MLDLLLAAVLVIAGGVECCRCNAVSEFCWGRASQTADCGAAHLVAWVL
jgi:hypothetical protein